MRITFSQIAGLQYITDGPNKYEAVYTSDGVQIYRAGSMQLVDLPERVLAEVRRRFDDIYKQPYDNRDTYILESKPCTI